MVIPLPTEFSEEPIFSKKAQTETSFTAAIEAYKAAIGQGEELQRNVDWEKGKRLYGIK